MLCNKNIPRYATKRVGRATALASHFRHLKTGFHSVGSLIQIPRPLVTDLYFC